MPTTRTRDGIRTKLEELIADPTVPQEIKDLAQQKLDDGRFGLINGTTRRERAWTAFQDDTRPVRNLLFTASELRLDVINPTWDQIALEIDRQIALPSVAAPRKKELRRLKLRAMFHATSSEGGRTDRTADLLDMAYNIIDNTNADPEMQLLAINVVDKLETR